MKVLLISKGWIRVVRLCILVIISFACTSVLAEIVLITSADSELKAISVTEAKDIFLKKQKKLNGFSLNVVDYEEGVSLRKSFYENVCKISEGYVSSYWTRKLFEGREEPPKKLASQQQVKEWVASHQNVIGYIEESLVDDTIKVIAIQ